MNDAAPDMVLEFITWPRMVILISGIGMWYINVRRRRVGFLFFSVAALGWAIYDWRMGAYEQAAVMAANVVTPLIGWWRWGKIDEGGVG